MLCWWKDLQGERETIWEEVFGGAYSSKLSTINLAKIGIVIFGLTFLGKGETSNFNMLVSSKGHFMHACKLFDKMFK